ncbi:membrane fusion protein (multidrug efflux system) [Novosphingobium sp. PhB165]|uniref:HlyD family secretion protein n=1 Tax=Novosphingobium sp. PhB165 TaxID=2485105 RepID=UPI001043F24D|nr:HlyD family secretion protein [Novosphingobium sp. PhB165]TCM15727.1 membrane fusion protein (multidrug efflux system) [Novosphingobium sp. PhB165]
MASDGIDSDGQSHGTPEQAPAPSPSALKRPTVRRALMAGVLVVVVAVGAWLLYYATRGKYLEDTNDAFIQADAVTVSPRISGYVDAVLVGDNQDVKAGQPLVRIDPRDYDAQARQYQAQIDVAKANADNIRATIGEQQSAITQAQAQLASAEADASYAEREAARYAPLAASGAETKEHLATLRNQAEKARAAADAQRAALVSAQRRIASLNAQVQQAEAQGEAAHAQLASAHVNVGSTVLRASVDGRIGDRTVRAGQFVQAGTRLMSVVPLSKLYVTANFKETQIGLMRPGQPATIEIDALDGTKIRGHVESISPGTGSQFSLLPPQNATGNFTKIVQRVPVRIAIDAGDEARRVLVPGLSVTVTVDTIAAKGSQQAIAKQEKARRNDGR